MANYYEEIYDPGFPDEVSTSPDSFLAEGSDDSATISTSIDTPEEVNVHGSTHPDSGETVIVEPPADGHDSSLLLGEILAGGSSAAHPETVSNITFGRAPAGSLPDLEHLKGNGLEDNSIVNYVQSHCSDYGNPGPEVAPFHLPENYTADDIQHCVDEMAKLFDMRSVPAVLSYRSPNASYAPGLIRKSSIDDTILLNPSYAADCVRECTSTDIIFFDIAHEWGHLLESIYSRLLTRNSTQLSERLADIASGFIGGKFGMNPDVNRSWHEWTYNGQHTRMFERNEYPLSYDRYGLQQIGYYLSQQMSAHDFEALMGDRSFHQVVLDFKANDELVALDPSILNLPRGYNPETGSVPEPAMNFGDLLMEAMMRPV